MISTFFFWGGVVALSLLVVLVLFVALDMYEYHCKTFHKPIIRICKLNGKIGVVLRRDYDNSSRLCWRSFYLGREHYDSGHFLAPHGHRLEVSPVFVFEIGSPEYYTLARHCYVEQATFDVPRVSEEDTNPIGRAHQYFLGEPWSGHLIKW